MRLQRTIIACLSIALCTASSPNVHSEDKDLKLLASEIVKVSMKAGDGAKTVKVD
jgi:hypothetical protein